MLAYTDEEKEKIRADSSHKELLITFLDDDTFDSIGNDRIYQESLSLVESLCDDENLKFGECESAELKIQVADVVEDIKGHEIQLDLTVNGVLVPLGIYYIQNVEKATDKRYKKLTCYDRMYYMNTDVIDWYNELYPTVDTTHTLKEFRDSFFEYMGIEQVETTLVNDDIIIKKTIDATELLGLTVIQAICEINGAFGHINRYGKFEYKFLDNDALFPSETLYPSDDLFPRGNDSVEITNAQYIPGSERGDYVVKAINKLQVRGEDGDVGANVPQTQEENITYNSYIVNGNFLVYGTDAETLQEIAERLSEVIFGITYTPHSTKTVAMSYMEVGDSFYLASDNDPFASYIFKRTLSGIQGMKDLWEAYGNEYQPEISIDNNREIIKLQSRVNILTRTVDENILEIERIETDLSGKITKLNSSITQTAEKIELKVSSDSVISSINQSAEAITIDADKINLQGIATFISNEGYITEDDLGAEGTTTINGGRIDTDSLFSRKIEATKIKITGDSTIQLGGTSLDTKQYIYLAGNVSGVTYETGFYPSQIYTYSSNGNSVSFNCDHLNFMESGTVVGGISHDNEFLLNVGDNGMRIKDISSDTTLFSVNSDKVSTAKKFYADEMMAAVQGIGWFRLADVLRTLYDKGLFS